MTQEEKELLIKDICARLPYGVKVRYSSYEAFITCTLQAINPVYNNVDLWSENACFNPVSISKIKPYLIPLSSMTEEQLFEVQEILGRHEIEIEDGFLSIVDSDRNTISYLEILALLEWFYKNHFDYRGLISMGLAIDATNLNIYYQ